MKWRRSSGREPAAERFLETGVGAAVATVMPTPPLHGRRVGPFEVGPLLGAGAMGEVYRARDVDLNREVALKILPEPFALDPDRLARFKREAQVLASLNHPNIAAIHGFEESNGMQALVLELVEGPTLADRIAQGPVPIVEALPIARQIAEGLEAAHEQGIVHRDLKPANIKLRPDGTVKVLDFGLAKVLQPEATTGGDLTASPTITSRSMVQRGVMLGTAAYMSPEQARGRAGRQAERRLGVRRGALRNAVGSDGIQGRRCLRHALSGGRQGHRLDRASRCDASIRTASDRAMSRSRPQASAARHR